MRLKILASLLCFLAVSSVFSSSLAAVGSVPANASVGSQQYKAVLAKIESGQKLQSSEVETLMKEAEQRPNDGQLHYLLGRYYESVKFGTLAAQHYKQAYELDKKNSKALVALSRIQLRMGDEEASHLTLTRAMNEFPNDYDVLVTAGLYMQRKGDYKVADLCYQKALKIAPPTAELLSALAELFYDQNQFVNALDAAKAALRLKPDLALAKAVRGKCLFLAHDYKRAIVPLSEAYHALPVNDEMAAFYSDALVASKDYEEALEPSLIAMSYAVGKPSKLLHYKRRVAGLIAGLSVDQVNQQIQAAEEKMRGSKGGKMLFFCLGDVFDRMHRPADAVACYRHGLLIDPNYGRGHLRLGMDLEDQYAEYDAALKEYETAFLLLSNDDEISLRANRLKSRMKVIKKDLAWQLKTNARRARASKYKQVIKLGDLQNPG